MTSTSSTPSVETEEYDDSAGVRVSVQSLGSGSSGNAFIINRGERTLMLDCGVGIRTMAKELAAFGSSPAKLDGLLITHEHIDHVRTLSRVLHPDLPIIATHGTSDMADVPRTQVEGMIPNRPIEIAGFTIWSLSVRHDAVDPCGFLIETPEARITIITDLGSWQDHLGDPLAASDLIVLEANHDEEMLRRGPYPPHLKRRVASEVGHLSNLASGQALAGIAREPHRSPTIWLAHLSDTNNRPHLAEDTVRAALERESLDLDVLALPRRIPGPVWTSSGRQRRGDPFAPRIAPVSASQLSLLEGFD